ncbi:RNA polymerase, sigma-24 subunit, ECF subfamily [Anaeromyxobacter dehalogenans 2CP-1]|uniref:RNA polymerase sigma factor n=1 Tax=Anaeromyxobacter dehalogenans (strain ATCC BAA-258 / DSM 21875 / 2CP-1) TaxID=455488 RepID=B8J5U2_ANAD2|nr:RNA polymerase sigma factor [Anaeromyxobacter dehalogenans]ACL65039.1 RNA polymerase, sigma-24 subunit, ECF subfamily [Anaeromyxobacter dehalogenans 2CP-1]
MTTPPEPTPSLAGAVQASWHRFLDTYEPLRPELYRYCRSLARSPWDADDLVQDAMARAFVTLGCMDGPPENPRAWLFRVASNLWIDRLRRTREDAGDVPEGATAPEPRASREAAGTLIGRLSPQERAAVVLKEAFDLSLEEIAEALATSVGAVKAALHRGRGKLAGPDEAVTASPSAPVLDAFCAAFNAGDLERLVALLLDTASVEVVRVHAEYGRDAARKGVFQGMMYGSRRLAGVDGQTTGIDPRYRLGALPDRPRCEVRLHRGEPVIVHWYAHADGEAVRALTRLETSGDRLSRVRNYFYTPGVIAEVCGELGLPYRINGYRYW